MEQFGEAAWRVCSRRTQQGAEVYCIFLGDHAALNASCPAMLNCCFAMCLHTPSMVHRDRYCCDLGTSEEEQVHTMFERVFLVFLSAYTSILALILLFIRVFRLKNTSTSCG